eukprot:3048460-Pyramimonas_sp.AAC.2
MKAPRDSAREGAATPHPMPLRGHTRVFRPAEATPGAARSATAGVQTRRGKTDPTVQSTTA